MGGFLPPVFISVISVMDTPACQVKQYISTAKIRAHPAGIPPETPRFPRYVG
jgi:hypothetical protein